MKTYVFYRENGLVSRVVISDETQQKHLPDEDVLVMDGDCRHAIGTHYINGEFVWLVDETKKLEIAAVGVRGQRNQLLAQSDWTQLPDVPLDTKESWATYRKHLRDITSQLGFPTSVVWPVEPTL